ncbi:MAG: cytochrome c [Nitrospirota bacterium]|nr:cytochrome c [Nitrospirota bacterium]
MKGRVLRFSSFSAIILAASVAACADNSAGAKIFQREKCMDCHTMKGRGGAVGPNLTTVGARRNSAYIREQIRNPSSQNPNTAMPSFKDLSEQDMDKLVEYLSNRK